MPDDGAGSGAPLIPGVETRLGEVRGTATERGCQEFGPSVLVASQPGSALLAAEQVEWFPFK